MAKYPVVTEWGNMFLLRRFTEGLLDAKKARVSAANRAESGFLADENEIEDLKKPTIELEKECERALMDAYHRVVPTVVQEWAAGIPGLGSGATFPSIIGLIGNPRVAAPQKWVKGSEVGSKQARVLVDDGEPYARTVRQLWQYAGCGDPMIAPKFVSTAGNQALKLRMGKRTTLRPRLYTFTTYLQKQRNLPSVANSKYGKLLIKAKADGLAKVHEIQCQNKKIPPLGGNGCGTVANPELGAPGSPWRRGHAQAHAFRVVQKEFLKDLWEIAGTI